jgi:hypothetical protein
MVQQVVPCHASSQLCTRLLTPVVTMCQPAHRVRDVLARAGEGWLKNTEVCDLLVHYRTYGLPICRHPPSRPAGARPHV